MKNFILLMSVILLTGCFYTRYEGKQYGLWRAIDIDGDRVCFTVDKNDVLESYRLKPNSDVADKFINNYSAKLYYPDTCFMTHLERAVIYSARYKMNQQWYDYSFIIDKDGQVLDLGSEAVCPYPNVVSL